MIIDIQTICQYATTAVRVAKSCEYREKYGSNTIVLFDLGNMLRGYADSAKILSDITGRRTMKENETETILFQKDETDRVFPRLVYNGLKIAIIDEEI